MLCSEPKQNLSKRAISGSVATLESSGNLPEASTQKSRLGQTHLGIQDIQVCPKIRSHHTYMFSIVFLQETCHDHVGHPNQCPFCFQPGHVLVGH